VNCAVGFFVSLYKSDLGIPAYFKKDLRKMTENMQAIRTQSRHTNPFLTMDFINSKKRVAPETLIQNF